MKPIVTLNNQQLLDIVNKVEDREKITEYVNDVGFFISHYNIRKGTHLVGIPLLFRLYLTWAKAPGTYKSFKQELSNYIKVYKSKYVHISIHALNITKETYKWLLKKEDVTVNSRHTKYMESFLSYYNVVSGTCWISHTSLYKVARHYCLVNHKKDLNLRTNEFVNYLKLYLPYQFTNKHMFRINEVGLMGINDEARRIQELHVKKSKKQKPLPRFNSPLKSES